MVESRIPTDLISFAAKSISLSRAVDFNGDSLIGQVTRLCDSMLTATDMLKKLGHLSATGTPGSVDEFIYECNGMVWRVGRCQASYAPFICADCAATPCVGSSAPSIFYANPCTDTELFAEDTRMNVLQIDYEELSVAPSIQTLEWTATKNTIAVTANVSEASGSLVCAAYLKSKSVVPSNALALTLANDVTSVVSSSPVFVLKNLLPAADYDIFCATFSSLGIAMKPALVLATKVMGRTLCCRSVTVHVQESSFSSGEDTAQALSIAIGDVLPDDLSISLGAVDSAGNAVQLFSPSLLTWSTIAPQSAAYTKHEAGKYSLLFSLSGTSAASYEILYAPSKEVTVLSAESQPPLPNLLSAVLSNDGTSVTVRFDSPTDKAGLGGNFLCSQLLSFSGLLHTTRCRWASDSSITIFTNGIVSVSVGLEVSVRGNAVKARCKVLQNNGPTCDIWDYMASAVVNIHAPANPMVPTVSIVGPTQIGPCDNLPLDISASRGSGGRSFASVTFFAEGFHPNVASVTSYLRENYKVDKVFTVPQELLFAGYAYNIIAKICNFMGGCGQSSLYVVVSTSSSVPVVSINAKQTIVMNRFSPLTVAGQAYVSTCNGTTSWTGLLYEWSLVQSAGPVATLISPLTSVSTNPRTFKLSPFTLTVGATYILTLTAHNMESFKFSSSSIAVNVKQGSVVAVVSGGTERGVCLGGSVDIDASGSYDEDTVPGTAQALLFSFTCVQTSPHYKSPSDLLLTVSNSSPGKVSITAPEYRDNMLDSVHVVTVSVKHTDGRVSSKMVTLRVLPSNAPLISLQSESGLRINPTDKLKLVATVDTSFPTMTRWTINDPSIALADVSLSDTEKNVGSTSLTSPRTFHLSLVLPPGSLPQQSTFNFYMTCTTTTGHSASAAITISTNAPPLPGEYTVSPETGGVMLSTEFTFVALKWEDSDMPITYEFAYQAASGSYLVHRSRAELSHTAAPLPAGRDVTNYTLSTRLVVFDILNAQHAEYQDVQVLHEEMSAADKSAYLSEALEASNGFPDEMKLAVAMTSSIVNAVNCSTAPNCDSLNRESCSAKAGTCGPCNWGFVGESGQANSYCVSPSSAQSRELRYTTSDNTFSTSCKNDADCLLPHWHVCLKEKCEVRDKECLNNCSGVGRCEFVSVYNANISYTHCSVLNTQCRQRCVCPSGHTGAFCELSTEEYEQTLMTRHQLVETIRDVSLKEDATRDTVVSWIDSVAAICADSTGIADHTKVLMAELSVGYLRTARDLGLSYETIASVGVILDLVLDVDTSVLSADQSLELLQAYNAFIANDIVAGQNSVELVSGLFRSSVHAIDSDGTVNLATPMTSLESLYGNMPPQRAVLPKVGSGSVLKVTMIETMSKMSQVNSNYVGVPLGIRFNEQPCSSLDSSNESCTMTVVLQIIPGHQQYNNPKEWRSMKYTLSCAAGDLHTEDFTCPDSQTMTLRCNGSAGVVEQLCPQPLYETYCSSIGDDATACRMVARSPSNLTCECSLQSGGQVRDRRLQEATEKSSGDEVSIDIVAAGKSTLREFTTTWTSAADLNSQSVVHSILVLITVAGLAIIGIGALCIAARLDYMEEKVKASEDVSKMRIRESLHARKTAQMKPSLDVFNSVSPSSDSTTELTELRNVKSTLKFQAAALRVINKRQGKKATGQRAASISRIARGAAQVNRMIKMEELRIDESLPLVLRPLPIWRKFLNEVQMHHRWIGIVCHYSPTYSRPIRILSLLINILIMLFVQSVTYNIADPDDGTCETFTDAKSCLAPQSSISSSESKCYWDVDSETCHYRPFNDSMERVITVALFAAVISAPFAIFFQSLIMFVLAAETERPPSLQHRSSLSVEQAPTGQSRSTRRELRSTHTERSSTVENSRSTLSTVAKLSGTRLDQAMLFTDFNELMTHIKSYRQTLSVEDRREFDRIWGFTNMMNTDGDEIDVDVGVRFSRAWSKCGESRQTHKEKILIELGTVQRATTKEAAQFDTNIDDKSKGKRLLFLFIKDLMDGVNGDIVDVKDRVDNARKRRVPLWSKFATWAFLFLTSMGMLFYIYLFAMKQSESRQQSWFTSFVVWLIFDILLVSSGLVLVKHIIVPLMAMGDLRRVKKQVVRDIIKFKTRAALGEAYFQEPSPVQAAQEFNAARYFFPSYRLAMFMPSLPESKAILQYSTPYPKTALTKKSKSVQKSYDLRFNFIAMLISRVLVFAISSMISLPEPVQNILMELVSSSGLGYIIILHIRLFKIHPALAFFPCIAVAIIVHFLTISSRATTRLDLVPAASPDEDLVAQKDKDVTPVTAATKPPAHAEGSPVPQVERVLHKVPSTRGGLKTRRQSIMEGVALVQRLAHVMENGEDLSSSDDNDEDRVIEWEDGDECDPDLEVNQAVFQLSDVQEDNDSDMEEFRSALTTFTNIRTDCQLVDVLDDSYSSSGRAVAARGERYLSDSDMSLTNDDVVIRKPRQAFISSVMEVSKSPSLDNSELDYICPTQDGVGVDSTHSVGCVSPRHAVIRACSRVCEVRPSDGLPVQQRLDRLQHVSSTSDTESSGEDEYLMAIGKLNWKPSDITKNTR